MDQLRFWATWHFWQVITLVWGLLCIALLILEFAPRSRQVLDIHQSIRANKNRLLETENWQSRSALLKQQIQSLENQIDTLFVTVPRKDQMSVLVDCLHDSKQKLDISLSQITTGVLEQFEGYQEQLFQIKIEGGFHSINTFIDRVERSPYLIKVSSLVIQRKRYSFEDLFAILELRAKVVER